MCFFLAEGLLNVKEGTWLQTHIASAGDDKKMNKLVQLLPRSQYIELTEEQREALADVQGTAFSD